MTRPLGWFVLASGPGKSVAFRELRFIRSVDDAAYGQFTRAADR